MNKPVLSVFKRVYEVDPLIGRNGRGRRRIIRRTKDPAVTQRVLIHPGLWHGLVPAAARPSAIGIARVAPNPPLRPPRRSQRRRP